MAAAPASTPLSTLQALGQSVWLDDISREMLDDSELRRLIQEDGLQGLTSDPTTVLHALNADAEIRNRVAEGTGLEAIYEALAIADIARALDLFWPVYDRTGGADGYVSLGVSPLLAHDTARTLAEAKRLWNRLGRPNAMITIPGTTEGLPAIEEALVSGINVNVTLLFGVEAYEAVARTYIKALTRRREARQPIDQIASVASFFVSRIDDEVNRQIEAKLKATDNIGAQIRLEKLLGQVAIASARTACAAFRRIFEGPEFAPLKAQGGRVQRLLWASVSTRNPRDPDTKYTDELIGPETVSAMPRPTYDAFKDHGRAAPTLLDDGADAARTLQALADAGIEFKEVTDRLLKDGIAHFIESYRTLLRAIGEKRTEIVTERRIGRTEMLGAYAGTVSETLARFESERVVPRLWDQDATLWKTDPGPVRTVRNALGWLRVIDVVRPYAAELERFGNELAGPGFSHIVVMGMGGSILSTEVIRRIAVPFAQHPTLIVLDSTVPATIRKVEGMIDPAHTLFVVASKSGTTTESHALLAYFFDVVKQAKGANAGENFLAITDPGTLMEARASRDVFRRIFLNPSDIVGCFSALSYFGMVPAALMRLDVAAFLDRARVAARLCGPDTPIRQNPGAALGAALGALARAGRDKVTLITPPPLDAPGLWIEQLLAESTGKDGVGILPVAGEPLGGPEVYGDDRVFVQIRLLDQPGVEDLPALQELAEAGHPVLDLVMADLVDLGAEFFRWEVATALAGKVLGINPFDQPDIQESKDHTKALLHEFKEKGALPEPEVVASFEGLTLHADPGNKESILQAAGAGSGREGFVSCLRAHFARAKPRDYVALTQFFDENRDRDALLLKIRRHLRDALKVATTTGYGPRFLHSTGQFHKGGPNTGIFLQLTADDDQDIPIPGQPFGFATLVKAQALGDLRALAARGRRVLRLHLGSDVDGGLKALLAMVKDAVTL